MDIKETRSEPAFQTRDVGHPRLVSRWTGAGVRVQKQILHCVQDDTSIARRIDDSEVRSASGG